MSPRLKQTLVVVLACGLLAGVVPTAHAAGNMEVALQDDGVFAANAYYNRDKGMRQLQQLHVTRLRVNVNWATVVGRAARGRKAPKRINYNWAAYDAVVNVARNYGIAVQFSLTGPAPAFATGDHRIGPNSPNARMYGQFVKAAAQHFAGRVNRYSIWNEPNYVGWISPMNRAPRIYRALYAAGYPAIKGVDPTAQVLLGETSPYALPGRATSPLAFLRGVVCADRNWHARCGGLKTDGYAHHPYDFLHAPTYKYPGGDNVTLATISRLTGALDRLSATGGLRSTTGRPIGLYLTEDGYFASGRNGVSPRVQASRLTQSFTMAQRNPRVMEMLQYLLVKPSRAYAFFDTSIASHNGGPRPAFTALAKWAAAALKGGRIAGAPVNPNSPSASAASSSQGGGGNSGGSGSSGGSGGQPPAPSCAYPRLPDGTCPPLPPLPR